MFRCKTMPDNGFFGLDKVKNKLYYVRAGKGRTLSSLGVCISHINSMQWIRRRSKILRKMLMHKCKELCWHGVGCGREGSISFWKKPCWHQLQTFFWFKKSSDFGDMTMDFKVLFRIKKVVNDYIRGSYFLYLHFFLIAFFPDALIFGFTIAFNIFWNGFYKE